MDEMINFLGQEVKDQGHSTPNLDLETLRRHHSRPLRSSRISSYSLLRSTGQNALGLENKRNFFTILSILVLL